MSRLPAPLRAVLRIAGVVYLVYLAFCLLLLLPAMNIAAPWATREFLGRELRHDLLLFNPFTLSLELRNAELYEDDGHRPLGLRRLRIDLSLASLWRPGLVFDALRLEGFDLHVLRRADGEWHFADLLAGSEEPAKESPPAAAPGITIEEMLFDAQSLRFTDRSRPGGYSAEYRDFVLRSRALSTLPARRGDGRLSLLADSGGAVHWDGELALGDGDIEGRLRLENLDLTHLWRYVERGEPLIAHSANLDLDLRLLVDWSDIARVTVSEGSLRLHGSDVAPRDRQALPNTGVQLRELVIDGIEANSASREASINTIALRGLQVQGYEKQGQISLAQMFLIPGDIESPTPPEENAAVDEDEDDSAQAQWQVAVGEVAIEDSNVQWRSALVQPEVLRVDPLRARARELHWPSRGSSPFELELAVNDTARLQVSGEFDYQPGAGTATVRLDTLPLAWFNPLLDTQLSADIDGGSLSFASTLELSDSLPARVTGDVTLQGFDMRIHGAEDSAAGVTNLQISGIDVEVPERRLQIATIALGEPRGTLKILSDGSLNVSQAMRSSVDENPEPAASTAPEDALADTGEDASPPWALRIEQVTVRDGQLDFSDASLPLPFSTLIGEINADIQAIDSTAAQPLQAQLDGAVDGYAPVRIEASGKPFGEDRDTRFALHFRGLDIANMTPYSGTYAGYAIDSGSLTVDLSYSLQGQRLQGENRIVISQMQLGEPVESERAMQLPLKLGLALLTDSQGVIDLAVPISGAVDDPQFSLGAVIGRTIANVIIKAATAPFRLLAGLVNSDRDLENLAFVAGDATLTAQSSAALEELAMALEQRPKLQLRISGATDPLEDTRALQEKRFAADLLAAGLAPESLALRDAAYAAAVDARYLALGLPAQNGGDATLEIKVEALLGTVPLPGNALHDLAIARATAAKRALVTESGIDAARIAVGVDRSLNSSGVKMSLGG